MAFRHFEIEEVGKVTIYKRKGVRSMRLSIAQNGSIRVSLPMWAPYKLGVEFVRTKKQWIQSRQIPRSILLDGQHIGKAHQLAITTEPLQKASTRVTPTEIRVRIPLNSDIYSAESQKIIETACIRALKKEGEALLPQRLKTLADKHGFMYKSVKIKQLRGRWGSCNEKKELVFNCFLMQLPWDLIDYVILHELTHTQIMAHGKPFWDEMGQHVVNLAVIRKQIRVHQPILRTT